MKVKIKDYSLIFIIAVFIAIFYLGALRISDKQVNKNESNTSVVLENGWTLDFNGVIHEDYSFGNERFPLTNKGDTLVFTTILPKELPINPVLCFRTIHSDIAVSIDDEQIYSYGREQYNLGKYVSSGTQFIDMKSEYAGKTLKIALRVSENHAFSSLQTPYISNSNFIHRDFIIKHQVEMFCIIFLTVLGILGMAITAIKSSQGQVFKPLWGIAAFSFSVGLWSLCTSDLMLYFTYNIEARNIIEYASLYAAPFFAFTYFGFDVNKESKLRITVYRIIYAALAVFMLGSWTLHALNIVHFPTVLVVCHILIVVIIVYLIISHNKTLAGQLYPEMKEFFPENAVEYFVS